MAFIEGIFGLIILICILYAFVNILYCLCSILFEFICPKIYRFIRYLYINLMPYYNYLIYNIAILCQNCYSRMLALTLICCRSRAIVEPSRHVEPLQYIIIENPLGIISIGTISVI